LADFDAPIRMGRQEGRSAFRWQDRHGRIGRPTDRSATMLTQIADPNLLATLLEVAMLICFGVAWPLANLRMLRSGRAEGKGTAFTAIILCGYVAGALAKLVLASYCQALPPVFWLYVLNTVSVGSNLLLQWRLGRRSAAAIGLTIAG
jgi:hypothetical protein